MPGLNTHVRTLHSQALHTALYTCAHNIAHDQRVHLMGRCKGELPSARLCFTGGRLRGKMLKKCVVKAEHTAPIIPVFNG